MKSIQTGLLLFLCATLAACSRSKPQAAQPPANPPPVAAVAPKPQTGKLQGSILIVGEGGRQVPLSSVTVRAIDEKQLQAFLAKTDLNAEATTLSLRLVVSNPQSELKAAQKVSDQAQ